MQIPAKNVLHEVVPKILGVRFHCSNSALSAQRTQSAYMCTLTCRHKRKHRLKVPKRLKASQRCVDSRTLHTPSSQSGQHSAALFASLPASASACVRCLHTAALTCVYSTRHPKISNRLFGYSAASLLFVFQPSRPSRSTLSSRNGSQTLLGQSTSLLLLILGGTPSALERCQ